MTGSLKKTPFGQVISELGRAHRSGILTVTRGDVKKQICFLRGIIRLAASNLRSERLSEHLRRNALVAEEVLERIEAEHPTGAGFGAALVEMRVVDGSRLRQAVNRHLLEMLLPCLEWSDGNFQFTDGIPNIAGEVNIEFQPLDLLLTRARLRLERARLTRLASSRHSLLTRLPLIADEYERAALTSAEAFVLSGTRTLSTVGQVLSLCPQGDDSALAALQTLIDVGAVQIEAHSDVAPGRTVSESRPQMESSAGSLADDQRIQYYLELYHKLLGGSHYEVLNVPLESGEEDIRRAYYQLAREIHPDRFGAAPLSSVRAQMEELFAAVTQAYNTLSDPMAREEYDRNYRSPTLPAAPLTEEMQASPAELAKLNFFRARSLVRQGKLPEALSFLKNAVSLDESRAEYFLLLGKVQAQHPRLRDEALESLKSSINLDPTVPEAHIQLGRLYRKLGREDEADREFHHALRWDPTNSDALGELQRSPARSGGGLLRGLFGRDKPE